MMSDSRGGLWVGTDLGLNLLEADSNAFKRFYANPSEPGRLVNHNIRRIFEDAQGQVWFATMGGLSRFNRQDGLLPPFILATVH